MAVADGVVVTSVQGELDIETAVELRRLLQSDPDRPARRVVDLSECSFIDSTGIGLLVRAYRLAERDGDAELAIVATPGSQVRDTLRLTNVDSRIPVLGSIEAALGVVGPG